MTAAKASPAAAPTALAVVSTGGAVARRGDLALAGGYLAHTLRRIVDPGDGDGGGSTVTNPKLKALLDKNPKIQTNQDLIEYFEKKGGDAALVKGAKDYGFDLGPVLKYRSASVLDNVYPPPAPNPNLPATAAEADRFHITEYADPKYNKDPNAPPYSNNCGPASLAMALDASGKMPPGLTGQQKIDYARRLMFPDTPPNGYAFASNGTPVLLLSDNAQTTGLASIANGGGQEQHGWASFDAALAAGKPTVLPGTITARWRAQFPDGSSYQPSGDVAHFVSVLGRTADGKYVVADPMYSGGPVEMTRDQLARFMGGADPSFVAVG